MIDRDARLVLFHGLRITRQRGGRLRVENPVMGSGVTTSRDFARLEAQLATPRRPSQLRRALGLTTDDLQPLLDEWILLREDELPLLAGGLVRRVAPSIGLAVSLGSLGSRQRGRPVIVGAPTDLAAGGQAGARFGPAEIRAAMPAGPDTRGVARGAAVADLLDIDLGRRYPGPLRPPLDVGNVVLEPGEGLDVFGERLRRTIARLLDCGAIPVTLGGDHSVTWFVLEALLARTRALGVLHFDAHHDLYPFGGDRPRLTHGNPFLFALRHPSLRHLHQLGVRTIEAAPARRRAPDPRLTHRSARDLQRLSPEEAFAGLPTDIPYYLSFDVDVLDPVVAPETGTPVSGGLSYYQALELLDYAQRRFTLVGADFVEVLPGATGRNRAATIVSQFVRRFVLGFQHAVPIDSLAPEPS